MFWMSLTFSIQLNAGHISGTLCASLYSAFLLEAIALYTEACLVDPLEEVVSFNFTIFRYPTFSCNQWE